MLPLSRAATRLAAYDHIWVRDHPYRSDASDLFIACRYVVYGTLTLLVGIAEDSLHVTTFAALPLSLVMHSLCRLTSRGRWLESAHLGEALLVFAWLRYVDMPLEVHLLAVAVFMTANTALWGWTGLFGQVLTVVVIGLFGHRTLPESAAEPLQLFCLIAALGFSLGISFAAHRQAAQLSERSAAWREENRTLRRYLPEDLPLTLTDSNVQRTWYCVGFVDLGGFTKATRALDDAALCTLLNDFLAQVTGLVRAWDGHIAKFLGDGVLCVFPASETQLRQNAAVQALRCLRQIPLVLETCRAESIPNLGVTIGIASGECLTGRWGGEGRFDYTVIGTAVNRAQRLQSHAAPHGGILMDDETATLVLPNEKPGPRLALNLKGFGHVAAFGLS